MCCQVLVILSESSTRTIADPGEALYFKIRFESVWKLIHLEEWKDRWKTAIFGSSEQLSAVCEPHIKLVPFK